MAGHPRAGFFIAIDSKFESAATGNAAEDAREFFVVLKFQPVNKTVPIAMCMDCIAAVSRASTRGTLRLQPQIVSVPAVAAL
jgi:hypothetical protein